MGDPQRTDLSGASSDEELVSLWLTGRPASTVRVYSSAAQDFLKALGKAIKEATVADVLSWSDTLSAFRDATRARLVATVKSLLSFAWRTGYTAHNVGRMLRCVKIADDLHERIVDEAVVAALVEAAPEGRDRALVRLLYVGGVRISEAVAVRPIDIQRGGITVKGKGSKNRTIALPEPVLAPLRALAEGLPKTDRIFRSYRNKPLGVRYAREIVYMAARRAGIDLSPHWLRHAHASHALDRGAPIHLVQKTLGHASLATTSRYVHVRPNQGSAQYLAPV